MKVKELIELLQKLDRPEHDVFVNPKNCGYDGDIVECEGAREVFAEELKGGDIYERDDKEIAKGYHPNAKLAVFIE